MYIYQEKKYIFEIKIDLSEYFEEGVFITLREPDSKEMIKIKQISRLEDVEREKGFMELYEELIPQLLVDHNIYISETEKMDSKRIAKVLFSKIDVATHVITKYTEEIVFLFEKKKKKK